ncbi:glyoxalase [Flavobacterium psychrophilum]|uniref:glyoxalase n=1 Tax=Flavobacterium psychrophilum TaxID=96345 RepID=UPI00106DBE9C|nr:glyoxalase [Flavobacterium psychrophilum]
MENRDTIIFNLRGGALGIVTTQLSGEEAFQNITLRPILKLQNDLLIRVFVNYAQKQKSVFFALSPEKKQSYIENVIQKDIKFRNLLKGIIIGFFTVHEYQDYIKNSSNLNKRMMQLLIERFKSQLQLLVA